MKNGVGKSDLLLTKLNVTRSKIDDKNKRQKERKKGCAVSEVGGRNELRRHENKGRLLSVVLLIGKPSQALQVVCYYTGNCF